jgi:hypothetical protein
MNIRSQWRSSLCEQRFVIGYVEPRQHDDNNRVSAMRREVYGPLIILALIFAVFGNAEAQGHSPLTVQNNRILSSPAAPNVPDNSASGVQIAMISVNAPRSFSLSSLSCAPASACTGMFAVSGGSVATARPLMSADDGAYTVTAQADRLTTGCLPGSICPAGESWTNILDEEMSKGYLSNIWVSYCVIRGLTEPCNFDTGFGCTYINNNFASSFSNGILNINDTVEKLGRRRRLSVLRTVGRRAATARFSLEREYRPISEVGFGQLMI